MKREVRRKYGVSCGSRSTSPAVVKVRTSVGFQCWPSLKRTGYSQIDFWSRRTFGTSCFAEAARLTGPAGLVKVDSRRPEEFSEPVDAGHGSPCASRASTRRSRSRAREHKLPGGAGAPKSVRTDDWAVR